MNEFCPFCETTPCRWVTEPPKGVEDIPAAIAREHHHKVVMALDALCKAAQAIQDGIEKHNVAIPGAMLADLREMRKTAERAWRLSLALYRLPEWQGMNFRDILGDWNGQTFVPLKASA